MKFCLVMWALGYPLVYYVGCYLKASVRRMNGLRVTANDLALNEVLHALIWVLGCLVILQK